jgi:hypothetical protein
MKRAAFSLAANRMIHLPRLCNMSYIIMRIVTRPDLAPGYSE